MKGISAIIAVVLILMITVALAAMAYVWFTDVFKSISTSAGESASGAADTIATSFSISSIAYSGGTSGTGAVWVSNTGTKSINLANVGVFVSGVKQNNYTSPQSGTLAPTAIGYFNFTTTQLLFCNKTTTVTYGGIEQITTITC